MSKRFAISDIHGNYQTFLAALDRIQLSPSDELYLLGDYVDRGPGSRQVISHIKRLITEGYQIFCLRGNHEQYMHNGLRLDDQRYLLHWLRSGGAATMSSYEDRDGGRMVDALDDHLEWIDQLPYYIDTEDYLFVHAGLNFAVADPLQDLESLIQIRRWKETVDTNWLQGRIVVHGHTPLPKWEIKAQLDPSQHPYPVLDIDAGCFHYKPGFGHLCIFDLDQRNFQFVYNQDMPLKKIRAQREQGSPNLL